MGLPPVIKYPWFDEENGQLFPFRTFAMLSSLITLMSVSLLSKWLFESGRLPPNFDVFHCVVNIPEDVCVVQEPHEEMTMLNANQALFYQTSELNGRVNPALVTEDETISKTKLIEKRSGSLRGEIPFDGMAAKRASLVGSIGPGQVIVTKL